jgi:predicted N-formylglutamate amidohydrolase
VLIELRQDLIATPADADAFTQRLFFVLQAALADMERIR